MKTYKTLLFQTEINLLRKFIGFHNKLVKHQEILDYISDLKTSFSGGAILKSSPYYKELNAILIKLKDFTAKVKEPVRVKINDMDRNWYSLLITTFEKEELDFGTSRRSKNKKKKTTSSKSMGSIPESMNVKQMSQLKHTTLAFKGMWKDLFGELTEPFDMIIHGEPHSGKTTFLLKFAAYLADNFGKVMYLSSEEFPHPSLTKKINELISPSTKNLQFSGSLNDFKLKDFRFIILDSVNDMNLDFADYKKMQKDNPEVNFILVLQHTKDGQFKGGKEWEHKVSVGAEIYDIGKIRVFRNRLTCVYGDYDFLSEKEILPQNQ